MNICKTFEYSKGVSDTVVIMSPNEFAMFQSMIANHYYNKTTPTFARHDIIEEMYNDLKKENK